MFEVRNGLATSLVLLSALLAVLAATHGLSPLGWGVGLACGSVLCASVARGSARYGVRLLGPADAVTLARATVACGVAALVAESILTGAPAAALVPLAAGALLLDAVDGRVARRTGTVSALGARFDGEADAFLILTLSVHVAHLVAPWVLVIGLARYAFGALGRLVPWLRGDLPVRYWAKVVAAIQGVVLTVAASGVAPPALTYAALLLALALLVESFGWSVRWLWRHRSPARRGAPARTGPIGLRVP